MSLLLTTPPDEGLSLPALIRLLRRALVPPTVPEIRTGTWTPTDASGAGLSLTSAATARYTRHGNLVWATFAIVYPATASGTAARIGGLPFTSVAPINLGFGGSIGYTDQGAAFTVGVNNSATTMECLTFAGVNLTNANLSGKLLRATVFYEAVP